MQETLNKIVMEFEETKEDFILKTIYPYCLHITEEKLSKEKLKKLLLLGLEQNSILDKIKAEILDLDDTEYDFEGYYKGITDAVKIIDKYKAESEG